jgi:hypothetical protein
MYENETVDQQIKGDNYQVPLTAQNMNIALLIMCNDINEKSPNAAFFNNGRKDFSGYTNQRKNICIAQVDVVLPSGLENYSCSVHEVWDSGNTTFIVEADTGRTSKLFANPIDVVTYLSTQLKKYILF